MRHMSNTEAQFQLAFLKYFDGHPYANPKKLDKIKSDHSGIDLTIAMIRYAAECDDSIVAEMVDRAKKSLRNCMIQLDE